MNPKLHIADDDLALYAAGALSAEERATAETHLRVCARCTEEVRQNTLALAAYAQTTPEAAPPQGAKDRFMARVAATKQGETSVPVQPVQAAEPKVGFLRQVLLGEGRWTPALAGALAILLLGVGVDDLQRRAEIVPLLKQAQRGAIDSAQLAQLMELLTSPQAKRVALHPGPVTAPRPEGRVVYAAGTGKLMLTASNLHPLPQGKTYELWILQPGGKAPLPAGTFAPDSLGNAAMILADAPAGLAVAGFGVTIENAGGSQTPTLPIVLSGL
jgi:anti-sigma-K factor RskA